MVVTWYRLPLALRQGLRQGSSQGLTKSSRVGGPLLHRTPPSASAHASGQRRVDAATASLQRVVLYSATRVPASPAIAALRRSPAPARSQLRAQGRVAKPYSDPDSTAPHATAATPAEYPVAEGDTRSLQRIPGGPKIARTPTGGRRAASGNTSPATGNVARRVRSAAQHPPLPACNIHESAAHSW